jgi:hypothetical protein
MDEFMRARIDVEIDKLVLHGFSSNSYDGEAISNAIKDALEKKIIRDEGIKLNKDRNSTREIPQIQIKFFNSRSKMDLENVGTYIANTIYSSWSSVK